MIRAFRVPARVSALVSMALVLAALLALTTSAQAQGSIINIDASGSSVTAGESLTIDFQYSGPAALLVGAANVDGTVVDEDDGVTDVGGLSVMVEQTGGFTFRATISVPADHPGGSVEVFLSVFSSNGPAYDGHTPSSTTYEIIPVPTPEEDPPTGTPEDPPTGTPTEDPPVGTPTDDPPTGDPPTDDPPTDDPPTDDPPTGTPTTGTGTPGASGEGAEPITLPSTGSGGLEESPGGLSAAILAIAVVVAALGIVGYAGMRRRN